MATDDPTSGGMSVAALVIALVALGASGYLLYLQYGEMSQVTAEAAELREEVHRLAGTVDDQGDEIDDLRVGTAALIENLQSSIPSSSRISSMESSLGMLQGDLAQITGYVEELGHCLLLEAEGFAYTYWTGTGFPLLGLGFQDVIERCQ